MDSYTISYDLEILLNSKLVKSTKKDPLRFFESLYTTDLFEIIKKEFLPTKDEIELEDFHYDEHTEIKFERFPMMVPYLERFTPFKKYYEFIIDRQCQESLRCIICGEGELVSAKRKHNFIRNINTRLIHLLNKINSNQNPKKDEACLRTIKILQVHASYYYYPKILSDKALTTSAENKSKNTSTNDSHLENSDDSGTDVGAFKWLPTEPPNLLVTFWEALKVEFIDNNTEFESFKRAFNGESINDSLKIKWIPKYGAYPHKTLLFHLLKKLEQANLIEKTKDKKTLYCMIGKIFCGYDGIPLFHLAQSKGTADDKNTGTTPKKAKINSIVNLLVQQISKKLT